MANEQNLIPFNKSKLSKEQVREINRKGGINSAKARKERKTFAEIYKTLLDETNEISLNGKKIKLSNKDILARKLITDILKGTINTSFLKGAEHIQATIGEAPVQKVEQTNYNIETKPMKMDIEELKRVRNELFGKK